MRQGVIVGLGEGVEEKSRALGLDISIGTRVVPFRVSETQTGSGAFAEYVTADAENVVPVDDAISDASASQLIVNPLTVVGMLERLAPPPGAYILQSAGGSTLGKQARLSATIIDETP